MANDNVIAEIVELKKMVSDLRERMQGLENAYARLNVQYNNHVTDLHIKKIDQPQQPQM